jgi:hypothetical protein
MSAHKYERTIAAFSYDNLHFFHRSTNIRFWPSFQSMSVQTPLFLTTIFSFFHLELTAKAAVPENRSEIGLALAFNKGRSQVVHGT